MTKLATFACGAALLLAPLSSLLAYDGDSEYVPRRSSDDTRVLSQVPRGGLPIAYYPTLRYYGKSGTIVYNFVPLDRSSIRRVSLADAWLLSPEEMVRGGSNTRVILKSKHLAFRETQKVGTVGTPSTSSEGPSPASETPAVHPTPADPATPASSEAPTQPATPEPAK